MLIFCPKNNTITHQLFKNNNLDLEKMKKPVKYNLSPSKILMWRKMGSIDHEYQGLQTVAVADPLAAKAVKIKTSLT